MANKANIELRKAFEAFEKLANQEARANTDERKEAVGILTPAMVQKAISKNQTLVLAYGRSGNTVSYSPDQLRKFLQAQERHKGRFDNEAVGVPIAALIRNSLPVDIQRSKEVKSAVFYQRKRNVLYFRVSGNEKPYYRVEIRLEQWESALADSKESIMSAVKRVLRGKVSIACPCGRHQYWYRYLATLGNYAVSPPVEHGFPKIRNPHLTGCCCKHVLKVLGEIRSNRMLLLLARELERDRDRIGYAGTPSGRKVMLRAEDLRMAQRKRLTSDAMKALEKYKQEAIELKKILKPVLPKMSNVVNKRIAATIDGVAKMYQSKLISKKLAYQMMSQATKLSVDQIKLYMEENNIKM